MSEELIVRHCSPTLAGLKTGNLFAASFDSSDEVRDMVRKWNGVLVRKGLRVLPLRCRNGRALIYVFRPKRLLKDLQNDMAGDLLRECGYCEKTPEQCIIRLMKRLAENDDFPHEIGLFLGYPPVDVMGFIRNKAQHCKCSGLWKVYGDEEKAKKTFSLYKKCTHVYCERWASGTDIERLTVAG